jgi:predicted RNase H-related nuclease YkuK (DUF458 family)
MNDEIFHSPNGRAYSLVSLTKEIKKFVDEEPSSFYSLIIGADSQAKRINGLSEITFVTAVVIYRKKKGARYFWKKEKEVKKLVLRDKIYTETLMSLNLAEKLVPGVRKMISPVKYDLEIHIDVGSLGQTRTMIREVVGMVTGNGYVAKTKPESWGASSVADKHT